MEKIYFIRPLAVSLLFMIYVCLIAMIFNRCLCLNYKMSRKTCRLFIYGILVLHVGSRNLESSWKIVRVFVNYLKISSYTFAQSRHQCL